MTAGHRWNTAGDDFLHLVMAEYREGDALHWPTVIAATACLSGEVALMTHHTRMPERGGVDSPRVAAFVHDGEVKPRTLWGYASAIASHAYELDASVLPAYRQIVLRLGMQLQGGAYPALDVPLHLVPRETPMNAGPRLRRAVHDRARETGLHGNDTAFALMTATMRMVGSARAAGLRDLTSLALQSCVAGSRFVPLVACAEPDTIQTVAPEIPAESASEMVAEVLRATG